METTMLVTTAKFVNIFKNLHVFEICIILKFEMFHVKQILLFERQLNPELKEKLKFFYYENCYFKINVRKSKRKFRKYILVW